MGSVSSEIRKDKKHPAKPGANFRQNEGYS
jgi:hypothetical protein